MDPNSCMSQNSETTDRSSDLSADLHPQCNISENDDLFEDDLAQILFLNSQKEYSSSLDGSQHIQALEQTLGLIDSILQPTNFEMMSSINSSFPSPDETESLISGESRPKSFLHDEMYEFNQIFSELVSTPQRKFPCRDPNFCYGATRLSTLSKEFSSSLSQDSGRVSKAAVNNEENVLRGLLRVKSAPFGVRVCEAADVSSVRKVEMRDKELAQSNHGTPHDSDFTQTNGNDYDDVASCSSSCKTDQTLTDQSGRTVPVENSEGSSAIGTINDAVSSLDDSHVNGFAGLNVMEFVFVKSEKGKIYEAMNEEDADSGYQTGDSSVPAMVAAAKKLEGAASHSRDDLLQRIEKFNSNKLGLAISLRFDSSVYEGNIRVHLNIYRPIKMSLSTRPSSIYDILIRTDARLPENESSVAFFRLPSNTFKAIHITSETTTNIVIKTLLAKFNITDNPKRFALYERILPNEDAKKVLEVDTSRLSNTLSFVRRLADDDRPLELGLRWADNDLLDRCQFVLQENDPGEILWEDFSLPELSNFLHILSKEEHCYAEQIRTKYRLLRRVAERRLRSIEDETKAS